MTTRVDSSSRAQRAASVKNSDDLSGYSSDKYDALIREMAKKYNVPARLIKSVIQQESGFKAGVTSPAGAQGLMQLMPGTASQLGVTDRSDPRQSIEGGTKYLAQMLDKEGGNVKLALAAYNAGPGNVAKYGGIPPFAETQNYVKNIMGTYNGDSSVGPVNAEAAQAGGGRSSDAAPADYAASSGRDYGVPDFSMFDDMSIKDINGMAAMLGVSMQALMAMTPQQLTDAVRNAVKSGDAQKAVQQGTVSAGAINSVVPDSFSAASASPVSLPTSDVVSASPGSPPAVAGVPTVSASAAASSASVPVHV